MISYAREIRRYISSPEEGFVLGLKEFRNEVAMPGVSLLLATPIPSTIEIDKIHLKLS
jgi:hypothetical protein